jgi:hypothetical protein
LLGEGQEIWMVITMNGRIVTILLSSIALISCSDNRGTEWISEEAGVAFRLPTSTDWEQRTPQRAEAKLSLSRKDDQAVVLFIVFPKEPGEVLNEEFVKDWEKNFYAKGRSIKVSGEFFDFKGKPAYKLIDKRVKEEVVGISAVILWIHSDKVLEIAVSKSDANPLEDEVIKDFIASMRFVPKSGSKATIP